MEGAHPGEEAGASSRLSGSSGRPTVQRRRTTLEEGRVELVVDEGAPPAAAAGAPPRAEESGEATMHGPLRSLLSQLSELSELSGHNARLLRSIESARERDREGLQPASERHTLLRELSRRSPEAHRGGAAEAGEAGVGSGSGEDEDTPAAAAERHRLGGGAGMDLQATASWLEQLLPFLYLLLVVFITQHSLGLVVLFWIMMAASSCNDLIRKQVALKEERRTPALLGVTGLLLLHTAAVVYLLRREGVAGNPLLLLPPGVHSVWHVFYLVIMTDLGIKLGGMAVKVIFLLLRRPAPGRPFRRQAQILTMLEYFMLVYRALLPCGTWYTYFLSRDLSPYMASAVTGMYVSFKVQMLWDRLQLCVQAVRTATRCEAQYGQYATADEVMEAGGSCSICQESMSNPLRLSCKHIFCEECVTEWFERERTCPLCRAVVKPAGLKSYGDGSTSSAPQLF
eukprot:jgi/Tetstr1/461434/TSEL_006543.t1